jgi:hypothetical protein
VDDEITIREVVQATNRVVGLLLAGVLFWIGLSSFARATTYTYTGSPFTTFGGADACPSECSLSGWFTISTLADDLTNVSITPTSFQFTDGHAKLNEGSPYSPFGSTSFTVTTNALGQITGWNIILDAPTVAMMQTDSAPPTPFDETWGYPLYANYASVDYTSTSGRWTSGPSPNPLPAALPLFATGFGVLGLFRWLARRKASALAT